MQEMDPKVLGSPRDALIPRSEKRCGRYSSQKEHSDIGIWTEWPRLKPIENDSTQQNELFNACDLTDDEYRIQLINYENVSQNRGHW